MSGKCKVGVYGMLTMDLITLDEMAPTWKRFKLQDFGWIHLFWRGEV
jgi:hypothetical protein